jgi:autotransporter translocation and assembly factor TamB
MKYLKRAGLILLIIIGVFYILPVVLLQIPAVQRFTSRQIAGWLENKINTKVEIGQISPGLFNELIIKDIYLEDQSGDTLLNARRISAGFDILPLIKKKLRFHSCRIISFDLNLTREKADAPLNIQYIIDAFAKKDSTETEPIDIHIKKIILNRGNFSYKEKNTPAILDTKFNPKSFIINDISSTIAFRNNKNSGISLVVEKLGFTSPSGLKLNNLSFDLSANKEKAEIGKLNLNLDKTQVLLSDMSIIYSDSNNTRKPIGDIDFQLKINEAAIYPNELSPFFPILNHLDEKINISGNLTGVLDNVAVSDFSVKMNNELLINSEAAFYGFFSNRDDAFVYISVTHSNILPESINRIINSLSNKPFDLPKPVKQMKNINFTGAMSVSKQSTVAAGKISTAAGNFSANVELGQEQSRFIRGIISSDSLNLATLLEDNRFGHTAFDLRIDATQQANSKFSGLVEGSVKHLFYKDYDYKNIMLNGQFSPDSYNGFLSLDSPEGKIDAKGLFVIRENDSEFNFSADIIDLHLNELNLTDKKIALSLGINADFTGNNADNAFGVISLKNLNLKTDKGVYLLDSLLIDSEQHSMEKTLTVKSRALRGELRGNYNFAALVSDLENSFATYLPALFKTEKRKNNSVDNTFSLNITVEDMKDLADALSLPFAVRAQTQIKGYFNSYYNRFNLDAKIPLFNAGGSTVENTVISFSNNEQHAVLGIEGTNLQKKNGRMPFAINFDAEENTVNTKFAWGTDTAKYHGKLDFNTLFSRQENNLDALIDIQQSGLVFNDSLWTLYPTDIKIDTAGIAINRLKAAHNGQFIKIDGAVSHNPEKELAVELNEVDLEYIFNSLNIPALEFGGIATGFVSVQDVHKTRKLSTHLDVKNFSFNQGVFGNLDLTGTWDDENQGVIMKGIVQKPDSKVNIDGIIYPVTETLSINFDADRADAYFLRKYLNNVAKNISGTFSGNLRLFGDLNNPTVEGKVLAHECRFGIDFLNTYYTFSDTVVCLPDAIIINNVKLHDEQGKTALANGYVHHNLFADFRFKADVNFENFMVYNAGRNQNPTFFGTAFGTGTARLEGTENLINIDVTLSNTANTKIALNFQEEPNIIDYDFIKFINPRQDSVQTQTVTAQFPSPTLPDEGQGTEIRLNLLLDVNQQAMTDMIMDPVSGDKISGYGRGNLQIQYGTKIPLRVLGTYSINRGKYNFSFQQALYRNFDIQEGSTVAFNGDPYLAGLNITANYTVQANLGDLDQQLIDQQQTAKGNIPVNCILKLDGTLEQPRIAFDIILPNSTDELNRQVKSYIRTPDMLNQQFLYLLVLSRFYTSPEYMRDEGKSSNNMSYLTSTLSAQLSNMLGSLNDNFQIGAKYHQSYEGNEQAGSEMEVLLSSQLLNDRLILNGNFGYIDRPYLYEENRSNIPLIGDFDLEYMLKKNGNIRLKFFNHYNYRYLSPHPEMTQGLGIVFRRDFNRLNEFFTKKNKK